MTLVTGLIELAIEILLTRVRVTSKWAWPAFLHGKMLKTASYSEAKEGARQQTSCSGLLWTPSFGGLNFCHAEVLRTRPL